MNDKVRKYLIKKAHKSNNPVYYTDLNKDCSLGFNLDIAHDRNQIGEILGDISVYEHEEGRPLLSAYVVSKSDLNQGNGFFELAESLGLGKAQKLKNDYWGITEINKCHEFWKDNDNYERFSDIDNEIEDSNGNIEDDIENEIGENDDEDFLQEIEKPSKGYTSIPKPNLSLNGVEEIDYIKQAIKQKELGDAGEELVLEYEQLIVEFVYFLDNLAEKVCKVSDEKGYDILSFDENGNEKYIEVKTTVGDALTPFYLSENEYNFMKMHKGCYEIYRVYDFDKEQKTGKFFKIQGDVESQILMQATQYRIYIKEE